MSIDIEECKQMAAILTKWNTCHAPYSKEVCEATDYAIERFPMLIGELIRYIEEAEARKVMQVVEKPEFAIGDRVRIIGPDVDGRCCDLIGSEFIVSQVNMGKFSCLNMPWYRSSSLELVEPELKVGDWVKAVGADLAGSGIGKVFQITEISTRTYTKDKICTGDDVWYYSASSLRKIPPLDQTISEAREQLQAKLDASTQAIRDLLAPLVDDRLKEIENDILNLMDDRNMQGKRISNIERKLREI